MREVKIKLTPQQLPTLKQTLLAVSGLAVSGLAVSGLAVSGLAVSGLAVSGKDRGFRLLRDGAPEARHAAPVTLSADMTIEAALLAIARR